MTTAGSVRLALLLTLAAVYAAIYAASGRTHQRRAGLDPMAPEVRAVERALRDGRLDEGLALATSLARLHPDEAFPLFLKATAHHRLSQWTAEADTWDRYVERSSSPELACPQVAEAYDRAGDAERALTRFRACVDYDPNDSERLADLAAALVKRRRVDDARHVYDRALTLDPANPLLAAEKAGLR